LLPYNVAFLQHTGGEHWSRSKSVFFITDELISSQS